LGQECYTARVSKRANKASLESLKDSQKTFTLSSTYTASPPAAETCSAETSADSNDDVELNSPQSDSSKANETVEQQAVSILDAIKTTCPEAAEALQALLTGLMNRIKCMEQQLVDTKAPTTYASAVDKLSGKRKLTSELRLKLTEATDKATKNHILNDSWVTRITKRARPEPIADPHFQDEPPRYEIIHLAGFDLLRDEPRATISAVMNTHYALPLDTIVNVSPMAPKLQELVVDSRRLSALKAAVAKSEGKLKISCILDARLPGYSSTDPKVIEESLSRFNSRLDREIQRLHKSPSRRLREVSDLLVLYKNEDIRKSMPRTKSPIFASAFVDEDLFHPTETTMVVDKT
jgi:hypothetical protein